MHGGVLSGAGSAILCAMGWILLFATGKNSPIGGYCQALETFVLIIVFALCLLINPYGADMVRTWLETLSMPLAQLIEEHGPLSFSTPLAWATLGLGAIYIIILLSVLPQRPRITWLLPLVFFALALRVRNAPLFAVAAVIALPDILPFSRLARWLERRQWLQKYVYYSDRSKESSRCHSERSEESHEHSAISSQWSSNNPRPAAISQCTPARSFVALRMTVFTNLVLPLILVSILLIVQAAGVSLPIFGTGWVRFDNAQWPVELLPELQKINDRASPPGNRIFNDLKFGGFLIYHTPKLQVFIDDRCPLYGGEFLRQYDIARRDDPQQIEKWQIEYHFSHALVQAGGPFDRYLQHSSRWRLLGRCPAAALYTIRPAILKLDHLR